MTVSIRQPPLAVVFGVPGLEMTADQKAFFRDADPLGLILFKRNCGTPDQLRRLCDDFRDAVGRADAPILIDHEGGQHQRMDPPVWPAFPPPARIGALYRRDRAAGLAAAHLDGAAIGSLLRQHGISVDCAPLADVPVPGSHEVIGDRAFSDKPGEVAELAGAFMAGMIAAGVTPIIKHIPGHGRAMVDSHERLPVVDTDLDTLADSDFLPFRRLAQGAIQGPGPWAMVAHIVFSAVDTARPASISPLVVEQVIRGRIGFGGVLISDCIYMEALAGTLAQRCAAVLASGIDICLSSHGDVDEWRPIAAAARPLTPDSLARLTRTAVPAHGTPGGLIDDVAAAARDLAAQLA
ncbi:MULTISPECIES: glycoside hydrolase family 3 N-terminal domain-containing protein [Nitrospirillum]|uniref:beta-N-acetylhexosaminidase n=1 Tax=Nitrospirillum amazonense TaxID=28077 RepID=A0A560FHL3_9PROT|nr:glycoside hydrolase family 3 N-terminal domain-containing protein [Nitrospirillum amazonense]MEC4590534.1 glycoside hydrolase family 3 N-terminal domain-containing protein [Nitrospirillum amazonense]TWB21088.1 beta-N-acetylhexosaminidase [Nitrospirillum amazonense]